MTELTASDEPPPARRVAVLDSSVLVPQWSRVILQQLAARSHHRFAPAWSEWIVAETWRVLAWRWLTHASRADDAEWHSLTRSANQMLRYLLPVMTHVSLRDYAGPPPWPGLRDQNDAPIWETAVVARAQYVVSQNTNDFPPLAQGRHAHEGVEYLTAIELIEDVLGTDATDVYGASLPQGALLRSARVPG